MSWLRGVCQPCSEFSPASSALSKGESLLDTARTYVAMGSDVLVVRHGCSGVPALLARDLEQVGCKVAVLNGGDGLHSHPSQALLDLFTLARYFNAEAPGLEALQGRRIVIVGDLLHSRVARSNLWALTACGADVVLCGPEAFCRRALSNLYQPHLLARLDPVAQQGSLRLERDLDRALRVLMP